MAFVAGGDDAAEPRGPGPRHRARRRRWPAPTARTSRSGPPTAARIAFFSEGRLRKIEAAGGPVQAVCDANAGRGGSWGRDGTIVFAPDITGPLVKVPAAGGTPTPMTTHGGGGRDASQPLVPARRTPLPLHGAREARARGSGRSPSAPSRAATRAPCSSGAPTHSTPTGTSSPWSTATSSRSASTPRSRPCCGQRVSARRRGRVLEPPRPGQYSVSRPASSATAGSACASRSSSGWTAPARSSATVGEPSYYGRRLHLGADGRTLAAVRSDAAGANADVWVLDLQRSQVTRCHVRLRTERPHAARSRRTARGSPSPPPASAAGPASTLWIQPASGSGSQQPLLEKISFSVARLVARRAFLVGDTQEPGTGFDVAYVASPTRPSWSTSPAAASTSGSPRSRRMGAGSPISPTKPGAARSSSPTSRKPSASGRRPARAASSRPGGVTGASCTSWTRKGQRRSALAARGGSLEVGHPGAPAASRERSASTRVGRRALRHGRSLRRTASASSPRGTTRRPFTEPSGWSARGAASSRSGPPLPLELPGATSEPTRSSRPSARGAWARSGARPTPGSGATSR